MNVLRDNEEKVLCPYNAAHHIRKSRMEVHLKKCRKSYQESEVIAICDFNASHRIPQPELQYHHDTCPDRKSIELLVFSEEAAVPVLPSLPAVPVPVDSSWDEEETSSYDPQKYCEKNHILRRIDTESAAVRRDFRIQERHRFNNLGPVKQQDVDKKVETKVGSNSFGVRRNVNEIKKLPPTPQITKCNMEGTPEEVTRMMEKVSIIPKIAVIPRQK